MARTIGYIVGSISSTSINRTLAEALVKLAPEGVEMREIAIKDLPFYSPDHDADYPAAAREFKQAIADVDGVLIVTPEYSRSIPGVLKNALDWASRPYGRNSFDHKPTAVIGASAGGVATAAAQQHLRAILGHFNATTMGQPEGFIQLTPGLIDENHDITVESTREFLGFYLQSFLGLIDRAEAARQAA
ncbi:NADPH-dependent FMN reductase [Microbacterium sp. USHLN186]|uniref:NADPH-dependent FMN reductase n=1 Tax=Microbacterium sp. USHLN186 TaxID=3081286 RepID=UPI0030198A96